MGVFKLAGEFDDYQYDWWIEEYKSFDEQFNGSLIWTIKNSLYSKWGDNYNLPKVEIRRFVETDLSGFVMVNRSKFELGYKEDINDKYPTMSDDYRRSISYYEFYFEYDTDLLAFKLKFNNFYSDDNHLMTKKELRKLLMSFDNDPHYWYYIGTVRDEYNYFYRTKNFSDDYKLKLVGDEYISRGR